MNKTISTLKELTTGRSTFVYTCGERVKSRDYDSSDYFRNTDERDLIN